MCHNLSDYDDLSVHEPTHAIPKPVTSFKQYSSRRFSSSLSVNSAQSRRAKHVCATGYAVKFKSFLPPPPGIGTTVTNLK